MDFPIKTTVGDFNKASGQVAVTFDHKGVNHKRPVNAVLNDKGRYDETATLNRVLEVANGVKVKIEIGAIKNEEPPAEPAPATEA